MSRQLCSAGLLYVYLSGYEENGRLSIQPIDSYRYIENGLYHRIMETAERSDCDDNAVHIFAVVGPKDKANTVHSIIENDLKENFKRILANKSIKINTEKLDGVGNTFFRCVQEFFCEQPGHFPKRIHYVFDDIIVGGICCSRMPDEAGDSVTGACISLWMEREAPMLCGQQLMTRSFFMRDFIGRKVITSIPDEETGLWRMVFEGGHQIYMDSDAPYTKETLHPNDLGAFCASNTLSVLINPVYAYGKWFQPNDICEEWHKVFLYLCAVSETEWDQSKICRIYEQFLIFLERNISACQKRSQ